MRLLLKSSTAQPLLFLMVSSADHVTPVTGITPTVRLGKSGGTGAAPSGAITEIDSTNLPGWYKVAGNATDTNTLGPLVLHATGTGADAADREWAVVAFDPQDVIRMGQTAFPAVATGNPGAVLVDGTGTAAVSNASGVVKANLAQILGTAITETAGQIAAGFKRFFNVASPTAQADNLPLNTDYTSARAAKLDNADVATSTRMATYSQPTGFLATTFPTAVPGAAGGLLIAGANAATTFATLTITGTFSINGTSSVAQSGDTFSRVGVAGAGLTALAQSATALSAANWGANPPAGFTAVTFPAGTLANTTNITAGTIAGISGDIAGRVLGGGSGTITGIGVHAADGGGNAIAPAATALSSATWTPTRAANLDNLDVAVSTRLAGSVYAAPLDAAGTRGAVGLASANLDTQLALTATAAGVAASQAAIIAHGDANWGGGGGGGDGPGADHVTLTFTQQGIPSPQPIANANVWIATDAGGTNVIAGAKPTNGAGQVTFLLTGGVTYYCFMEKAGENPIVGQAFVAAAD